VSACPDCLRRPWLLSALSGHLDRTGARLADLLELDDEELLIAAGGKRRRRIERSMRILDADAARARARQAGLHLICHCDPDYPHRLRDLGRPPAVLHVKGDLERFITLTAGDPVAVVGTRRASSYGLEVAGALGRGLASAGLTVISGMAHGVDCAAHRGALEVEGCTLAVLAGGAEHAYPASARSLHRRVAQRGAVVSELPPDTQLRRWMFPARNRLVAGLSTMTVVVEAGERSGALLTASWAGSLGRAVGAVPGRVTSQQAAGTNRLIADGARLITGAQDVLDALYGLGARRAAPDRRSELDSELRWWLDEIAAGHDTPGALARAGLGPERGLQVLSALELAGYIRRQAGGRFVVVP
jgi:DNA processing protein